jgi:hypothetical protein
MSGAAAAKAGYSEAENHGTAILPGILFPFAVEPENDNRLAVIVLNRAVVLGAKPRQENWPAAAIVLENYRTKSTMADDDPSNSPRRLGNSTTNPLSGGINPVFYCHFTIL